MTILAAGVGGCRKKITEEKFNWVADRFDDIRVLKYRVPGFDTLALNEKLLIYYLSQAALSGRDILFDQNAKKSKLSAAGLRKAQTCFTAISPSAMSLMLKSPALQNTSCENPMKTPATATITVLRAGS